MQFNLSGSVTDGQAVEVKVEFKQTFHVGLMDAQDQAAFFARLGNAGIKEGILTGIQWAITGEDA